LEAIASLDRNDAVRQAIIMAESSVSQRLDISRFSSSWEGGPSMEAQKCLFGYLRHSNRLCYVDISGMELGEDAAAWAAAALRTNKTLKTINVLGNNWGESGVDAIIGAFQQADNATSLCGVSPGNKTLDLSEMPQFTGTDQRILIAELAVNDSIKTLDLTGVSLSNSTVQAMAIATQSNCKARFCYFRSDRFAVVEGQEELNLSSQGLQEADAMLLAALLGRNASLTRLNLLHNAFGVQGAQAIVKAVERRMCPYPLALRGSNLAIIDVSWKDAAAAGATAAAAATCSALWAYVCMRKARRIVRDARRGALSPSVLKLKFSSNASSSSVAAVDSSVFGEGPMSPLQGVFTSPGTSSTKAASQRKSTPTSPKAKLGIPKKKDRKKGARKRQSRQRSMIERQRSTPHLNPGGEAASSSGTFRFAFSSSMVSSVSVSKLYPAVYSVSGMLPSGRVMQLKLNDGQERQRNGQSAGAVGDAILLALELRTSLVLKSLYVTGGIRTRRPNCGDRSEVGYLEEGESSVKWKCLAVRWGDIVQTAQQAQEAQTAAQTEVEEDEEEADHVAKDLGWCAPVQGVLPWNAKTCRYEYDGVLALADALRCNSILERLRVERSSLGGKHGERAIKAIAQSLCQVQVGVDECEFEGEAAEHTGKDEVTGEEEGLMYGGLVQSVPHCGAGLVELGLAANALDDQCVSILAHMLVRNSKLHSLDISQNSLIGRNFSSPASATEGKVSGDDADAARDSSAPCFAQSCLSCLFEALSRPSLGQRITSLNLSHCCIGDEGVRAMGRGCAGASVDLTYLDISDNCIRSEGAAVLCEILNGAGMGAAVKVQNGVSSIGGQLTDLNVSGNNLGADGVVWLCEAIAANRILSSVNLARTCKPQPQTQEATSPTSDDGPIKRSRLPPREVAVAVRQVFQQNPVVHRVYII
jgi:Ran GTPase-activating protein (RanGAP) involved in mRNA processing and transport